MFGTLSIRTGQMTSGQNLPFGYSLLILMDWLSPPFELVTWFSTETVWLESTSRHLCRLWHFTSMDLLPMRNLNWSRRSEISGLCCGSMKLMIWISIWWVDKSDPRLNRVNAHPIFIGRSGNFSGKCSRCIWRCWSLENYRQNETSSSCSPCSRHSPVWARNLKFDRDLRMLQWDLPTVFNL